MTQILNIDTLAKKERVIILGGTSYPIKDISVADFIKINVMAEAADKLAAEQNTPISSLQRISFLAETIAVSIPTCPIEVLQSVSIDDLYVISAFVTSGTLPSEPIQEVEAQDGEKKLES